MFKTKVDLWVLAHILGFYRCYFFHTIRINFFSNSLEKSVKKITVTEFCYINLVS